MDDYARAYGCLVVTKQCKCLVNCMLSGTQALELRVTQLCNLVVALQVTKGSVCVLTVSNSVPMRAKCRVCFIVSRVHIDVASGFAVGTAVGKVGLDSSDNHVPFSEIYVDSAKRCELRVNFPT
eukprot:9468666-Pyramimonas_sp.AAC.4